MELNGKLSVLLSKIVDDLLFCGPDHIVDESISRFKAHFTIGTVVRGHGTVRYFGINIIQHEDFTVTVNGDDELDALGAYSISRICRRNYLEPLNPPEVKSFASINSSVKWLGITVSPFCSLFSSLFQQLAPTGTVGDLCKQSSRLNKLNHSEQ